MEKLKLRPTPTRLALLREIANPGGGVFRDAIGDDYSSGGPKVNARISEAKSAGWIVLNRAPTFGYIRYWELTDAGQAVLDAHPEASL